MQAVPLAYIQLPFTTHTGSNKFLNTRSACFALILILSFLIFSWVQFAGIGQLQDFTESEMLYLSNKQLRQKNNMSVEIMHSMNKIEGNKDAEWDEKPFVLRIEPFTKAGDHNHDEDTDYREYDRQICRDFMKLSESER